MRYLLLLLILFSACYSRVDINCKYQGAVVYDRMRPSIGAAYLTIKYQGNIFDVYVYKIDETYKVGDTINKPCAK